MLVPVQKAFFGPSPELGTLYSRAHKKETAAMEFTISVSPWDRGAYTTNKNAHSKIIPSTPLTCFHWRQSVTHKFSLGRVVLPLASQSDSASSQWAEIHLHSDTVDHTGA